MSLNIFNFIIYSLFNFYFFPDFTLLALGSVFFVVVVFLIYIISLSLS